MLQLKTQWIYIPKAELFSYVESMLKRDHLLSSYYLSVKICSSYLSVEYAPGMVRTQVPMPRRKSPFLHFQGDKVTTNYPCVVTFITPHVSFVSWLLFIIGHIQMIQTYFHSIP